jgi:hypothetical protein
MFAPYYTDEPDALPYPHRGYFGYGYGCVPPPGGGEFIPYRPSLEGVRKKKAVGWDQRRAITEYNILLSVPVTRPGSWQGDPWLGHKTEREEGWVSIELGKVAAPPAAARSK